VHSARLSGSSRGAGAGGEAEVDLDSVNKYITMPDEVAASSIYVLDIFIDLHGAADDKHKIIFSIFNKNLDRIYYLIYDMHIYKR